MIIDVHGHYHPQAFNEALADIATARVFRWHHPDTDSEEHIQAHLEMMDEAEVAMQVLSPMAGRAPYAEDEAAALNAARLVNDGQAELVSRYPSRFRGLVSVPLPHIDASLRELERGMDELGMIGLNLHITAIDRSTAEDEFLPLYEEMNRRGGTIFYHPCGDGIRSPMINDYGLSGAVGTSLEDAVIVLHLIAKQLPSKFPNITFIVPHLGGPIPMLLDRLNNQFSMEQHSFSEPPKDTARRLYYDTVAHGSHAALKCAWMAFGADHILPGSDFPVLLSFESYRETFSWIRDVDLPADDIVQILERTAPSILNLN